MRSVKNLTKNPGAPAPAPVPTGNRVKDLAALHEWEQKKANPGSALTAARAKVDRIKKWLTLQGVQVKADGSIDWPQDTHVVEYDKNLATQGLTMLRFNSGRVFLDDSVIKLMPIAFGVACQIHPVPCPALAVLRRSEQSINHFRKCVRRLIGHKCFNFSRTRR